MAWALAGIMITPFAATAAATWLFPEGRAHGLAGWGLALSALALIAGMGGLRIVGARRHDEVGIGRIALAAIPGLGAALATTLIPIISFRWALALLMGALAGQGLWDFGGRSMPRVLMRIRPAVTVGAVIALLVGFIGC